MYPTMFIKFAHNPKTLQYYDNYLILYDNFISIPPDQSILNIDGKYNSTYVYRLIYCLKLMF